MMKKTVANAISLISGLIFGFGLIISDMANPLTVQDFLDIAGDWNGALLFVMLGALIVASIGFWLTKHKKHSLLGQDFPSIKQGLDKRLIIGSLIFGMGWGIAGICPASALVLVGMGVWQAVVFFAVMFVAMFLTTKIDNVLTNKAF